MTQIKQFNQNRIIIYTNSRIINYSKIYIKKIIDQQLTFNIHLISLRIDTRQRCWNQYFQATKEAKPIRFFAIDGSKEDLHRKVDFPVILMIQTTSASWHEMMACQLIFVQPIIGLIQ